jgi:hypothetical protein
MSSASCASGLAPDRRANGRERNAPGLGDFCRSAQKLKQHRVAPDRGVFFGAKVATNEEIQRRLRRILYWSFPVTALMLLSSVLSLFGIDSEPWLWTRTILLTIAVVVMIVLLTRFLLWQRDEYWRERGKDPKHPLRFRPSDAE